MSDFGPETNLDLMVLGSVMLVDLAYLEQTLVLA